MGARPHRYRRDDRQSEGGDRQHEVLVAYCPTQHIGSFLLLRPCLLLQTRVPKGALLYGATSLLKAPPPFRYTSRSGRTQKPADLSIRGPDSLKTSPLYCA